MPRTISCANDLTAELLLAVPKAIHGCRVWRMNQGGAYPIQSVAPLKSAITRGDLSAAREICARLHPMHFGGPNGMPDIDGLLPDGRRLGIEVKWGKDKQSEDQRVCQRVYEDRGAIYIIANDVDGTIAELSGKLK